MSEEEKLTNALAAVRELGGRIDYLEQRLAEATALLEMFSGSISCEGYCSVCGEPVDKHDNPACPILKVRAFLAAFTQADGAAE